MGQDCPNVLLYMMHSNNNNNIYIYIAEIVASWEKESGSLAKLWASNIRFGSTAHYIATDNSSLREPSHLERKFYCQFFTMYCVPRMLFILRHYIKDLYTTCMQSLTFLQLYEHCKGQHQMRLPVLVYLPLRAGRQEMAADSSNVCTGTSYGQRSDQGSCGVTPRRHIVPSTPVPLVHR